jgi:hypothetical protein
MYMIHIYIRYIDKYINTCTYRHNYTLIYDNQRDGSTALMDASGMGFESTVITLLQHNAKIDASDCDMTVESVLVQHYLYFTYSNL